VAQEFRKTAAGVADIASDAQYRGVSSSEGMWVLPGEIFVEAECQMRT